MRTLLLFLLAVAYASGTVVKEGNPILSGGRSPDKPSTAYFVGTPFGTDGVVFAFSAFYVNTTEVYVDVWRPENSTAGYQLVGQWPYTSISAGRREDVYLQTYGSGLCLRVSAEDRLGLYFPTQDGSIPYDFVMGNPTTLQTQLAGVPAVGDVVVFDTLPWPYKFPVAVYLDTDVGRYPVEEDNPTCFGGLTIPPETDGYETTPATPTTPPGGATGATGPVGGTGWTGPRGDRGQRGEDGSTGFTGPIGSTGFTGVRGPSGAVGPRGQDGVQGDLGEKGDEGDKGEQGAPGNVTIISSGSYSDLDCSWCPSFLNATMILGLVIWLAIVTLLLFITLIVACCRRKPQPPSGPYPRNVNDKNMWKNYENGGFDNEKPGPPQPGDSTYAAIEEGRTEF